ncbi:hypothetical protein KJJ19_15925, partial [Acinetobacter towneri]|nr:hypothetical protein [Acinetobacter towneri]
MEGIHLLYLEINKIFSLSCQPICNSALVSDEEYRQLQQDLLVQPDRGDLIKNGGGIRKVRCAQGNKGK